MKYDIPCVILSGGKSRRMGEDKSLLPFGQYDTMIEYQYKKLSKLFKKVYISSKTNKFNFDANIIYDNDLDISSPMVALESIMNTIKNQKVFIITVDTPLIQNETIDTLIKNSNNHEITIAKDEERTHNLCGVFDKKLHTTIKKLIGDNIHKINYLIKQTEQYQIMSFDNKDQFINLNTTIDYTKAKNISVTYM